MSPLKVVPTPHAIRDKLTAMVVNDLLDPACRPEEELDRREDRVTGRYLSELAPERLDRGLGNVRRRRIRIQPLAGWPDLWDHRPPARMPVTSPTFATGGSFRLFLGI